MLRCADLDFLPPVPEQKTDGDIQLALRLERRLQCEMQLTVRVHACENRMQLFGMVASWYQKQRAQEIARELAPEYRIRNDLRVIGHHC